MTSAVLPMRKGDSASLAKLKPVPPSELKSFTKLPPMILAPAPTRFSLPVTL